LAQGIERQKKAIMAVCRCQASHFSREACNVARASIAVIVVSGESGFNAGEFGK
jgi:hypothetical protein